jgi:hypothetical protein
VSARLITSAWRVWRLEDQGCVQALRILLVVALLTMTAPLSLDGRMQSPRYIEMGAFLGALGLMAGVLASPAAARTGKE